MCKTKKVFLLFLCFSVLIVSLTFYIPQYAEARTLSQVENDLKQYEKILSNLQTEKAKIQNKIKNTQGQSSDLKNSLGNYMEEIDVLEAEVETIQATIDTYGIKISELEADVLIQEENLAYYEGMCASMVVYSFKQQDQSIFKILFESKNFSDFLTKVDNMNYFLDYTNSTAQSLKNTIKDLETARSNHENAKTELDSYKANKDAKLKNLQVKKEELAKKAEAAGSSLAQLQRDYSTVNTQIESAKAKLAALKKEREEILNSEKNYMWPIKAGSRWTVTSWYGYRKDPFGSGKTVSHYGLDIAAGYGTPVVASKGGTVTRSEYSGGYGNVVIIYHGNGMSTLYAHNSKRVVNVGESVKQGEVIAYVGSTGSSTGNHLHFGVIQNGNYVNPDNYMPNVYQKKFNKF